MVRHCSILVVPARSGIVSLAALACDLADLLRVDFLPLAAVLLVFDLFAAVALELDVFFMGRNSIVVNTALIAAFAPPQAPQMARRLGVPRPEPDVGFPHIALLGLRPKSSGKTASVEIFCRCDLAIIPP
jgi:hypothetical protein